LDLDLDTEIWISGASFWGYLQGATKSKHVQAKIIQAQIDVLNSLDSKLQAKYEILTNIQQEYIGKMKEGQLASKKSGLRLAKEEIRRDLKELQQQLKQLEDETDN
jgi:hypothetical protein